MFLDEWGTPRPFTSPSRSRQNRNGLPNVVAVHDVLDVNGQVAVVMERTRSIPFSPMTCRTTRASVSKLRRMSWGTVQSNIRTDAGNTTPPSD